jgi:hypothetical protein
VVDAPPRLLRVQEQPVPTQQWLAAHWHWQTASSAAAAAPVCVALKRFEFFEKGSWHPYAPATMQDVSEQYRRGQIHADLEIAGSAYYIDFERLTQSKVDTGYTRSVQWDGIDARACLPDRARYHGGDTGDGCRSHC